SALTPQGRTLQASRTWADVFVGARVNVPIAPRWSFTGYADIGGGGSDSTWQALAAVDYAITPTAVAEFGYRYLKVDYHKDDFLYNMASGGLYTGVGMVF